MPTTVKTSIEQVQPLLMKYTLRMTECEMYLDKLNQMIDEHKEYSFSELRKKQTQTIALKNIYEEFLEDLTKL